MKKHLFIGMLFTVSILLTSATCVGSACRSKQCKENAE